MILFQFMLPRDIVPKFVCRLTRRRYCRNTSTLVLRKFITIPPIEPIEPIATLIIGSKGPGGSVATARLKSR